MKQAKEFEEDVHHAEAQASRYDLGEALLQIGVVLCSITLIHPAPFVLPAWAWPGSLAGIVCAAMALTVK